ncbi:SDR family oxidoreductase [Burkholderia humptydooensis]|uniref:SDR family oxidoreductase n=1 Tax=Burkholderia humptydooensis TaxID=430531 RepID=A0A7U4P6Q7_9BURK|nr:MULTISPECIES: SDR family oxidoreductase [Burkholderia]ALX43963.1 short-chain dehydrogenase [Burkholderia humptydooensis]QPS44098.1 SDR family oxidoreductase [Burkholderia humptydooensis]
MTAPADTCDTSAARSARVVLITGAVQTGAVQAGAAEAARASAQQTPAAARPAPGTAAVGHALAVGFARRGWDVALAVAAGDEARAAAALAVEVEALGRRAAVLVADLSVEADVARLVAACDAALGRPTCVVAQAAGVADNAHDVGYASLAGAMARGVAAPLVLARALADATPDAARDDERERAVVIHLLDETLFHPAPERLSHSLAQAALHRATTAQALALAPKVRVVGLACGRAPHARDIADAACYLADAPGVTGATLTVDGGEHLAPPADERN